jgi:hypothetical protein
VTLAQVVDAGDIADAVRAAEGERPYLIVRDLLAVPVLHDASDGEIDDAIDCAMPTVRLAAPLAMADGGTR